jgi:hypothetical protein
MKRIINYITYILKRIRRKIFGRQFPKIKKSNRVPKIPLSFVVVRFSNEYEQNILASKDVNNNLNELVTIDNFKNLNYDSLAHAMNAGIEKSNNEIIVIVHEDTFLPAGWQTELESAIKEIEKNDPEWGILGVAGLDKNGSPAGHYSDPNNFCNTFKKNERFVEATSVDEHLMMFRRKLNPKADENIVGIHGIGTDMVLTAIENGNKCYIINAPSIHKYRDGNGKIIQRIMDSPKIKDRLNYAYKADKICCDEYVSRKWNKITPFDSIVTHYDKWTDPNEEIRKINPKIIGILDSPVVLLGKGGGGSRLLSLIASDCGIFLGNDVNISGDCMDIVIAIYQAVIEKYKCKAQWQKNMIAAQLRLAAAKMLDEYISFTGIPVNEILWGFKLPESLLLMPEINAAFPNARYVHMLRDPAETCLRRTHMTARLDNQVGRVTLPLAYRSAGQTIEQILKDPPEIHNAYTTLFQLKNALEFCKQNFNSDKYYELNFDDILNSPTETRDKLCKWLGVKPSSNKTAEEIDINRAKKPKSKYSEETINRIKEILKPLL